MKMPRKTKNIVKCRHKKQHVNEMNKIDGADFNLHHFFFFLLGCDFCLSVNKNAAVALFTVVFDFLSLFLSLSLSPRLLRLVPFLLLFWMTWQCTVEVRCVRKMWKRAVWCSKIQASVWLRRFFSPKKEEVKKTKPNDRKLLCWIGRLRLLICKIGLSSPQPFSLFRFSPCANFPVDSHSLTLNLEPPKLTR